MSSFLRQALPIAILVALSAACSKESNPLNGTASSSPATPYTPTDVGLVLDGGGAGEHYVALGDSAASGPLIPVQRTDPSSCLRSNANYPSVLAANLGVARFQDMTCSGALTDHLFEAQADNPPQLDALRPDTTLVTLGPMGANDVGTTGVFTKCGLSSFGGFGPDCASFYPVVEGRDQFSPLLDEVGGKIGAALDEIHRRSPNAKVYVVGYGIYFPVDGCFPIQPYSAESSNYIQALQDRVSDVLRQQAESHGAQYVSLQEGEASAHSSCALPLTRWIEGLVPTSIALDFHPSALGMMNFAAAVQAAINTYE